MDDVDSCKSVVSRLSSHTFWLIRSLVDPTLAAFIAWGPLQFLVSHFARPGPPSSGCVKQRDAHQWSVLVLVQELRKVH